MGNKVVELLNSRFAGRSITSEPLEKAIVAELIQAARLTPSCFNNQPWRFLFLQSADAIAKGTEALSAGNKPWAGRAPLLIVGYTRATDDCQLPDGREYHQFDLGMSVMNILLAATHHGLAARPMAGFDPAKIKQLFKLEEDCQPLVMISVGHTSTDESHLPKHYLGKAHSPRERKDADEIVTKL
ncbi:MAG: nitroreductase family protein [Candidatus Alcyoniella australis]|nr:nitroreductase family protein [Candidatus Alcyoniella australis]